MLLHTERIRILRRQKFGKVTLDLMFYAEFRAEVDHPNRVLLPFNIALRVIQLPYLVKVHKFVRFLHDGQTCFCIERRLEADPGENTRVVEGLERCDTVCRKCSIRLSMQRCRIVEAGDRRGECVAVRADQVEVSQRSCAPWVSAQKPRLCSRRISIVCRVRFVLPGL